MQCLLIVEAQRLQDEKAKLFSDGLHHPSGNRVVFHNFLRSHHVRCG